MKIKEMNSRIKEELPKIKGIIDKTIGKRYMKGEHPFYDMEIENYIVCPDNTSDWNGFTKDNYELIYKTR